MSRRLRRPRQRPLSPPSQSVCGLSSLRQCFGWRLPGSSWRRIRRLSLNLYAIALGFEEPDRERSWRCCASTRPGLGVSLCFQNFEAEVAGLPGDYAPPARAMLLARSGQGRFLSAGRVRRSAARPACEMNGSTCAPLRGRRLGRTLALAAMAEARRLGYARMCLDTLPSMTSAQASIARSGFARPASPPPSPPSCCSSAGSGASHDGRRRRPGAAARRRARARVSHLRRSDGTPLLFLHGTPGSRLKFVIAHETGKELGLALVAPDRWGYGLSDVPDKPSLPALPPTWRR